MNSYELIDRSFKPTFIVNFILVLFVSGVAFSVAHAIIQNEQAQIIRAVAEVFHLIFIETRCSNCVFLQRSISHIYIGSQ